MVSGTVAIAATFAIFLPWSAWLSNQVFSQEKDIATISSATADLPEVQKDISQLKSDTAVNSALLRELSRRSGINVNAVEAQVISQRSATSTVNNQQ